MARVLIGIAPTATQKRIGSAGLRWPVKKVPDVDSWGKVYLWREVRDADR